MIERHRHDAIHWPVGLACCRWIHWTNFSLSTCHCLICKKQILRMNWSRTLNRKETLTSFLSPAPRRLVDRTPRCGPHYHRYFLNRVEILLNRSAYGEILSSGFLLSHLVWGARDSVFAHRCLAEERAATSFKTKNQIIIHTRHYESYCMTNKEEKRTLHRSFS